jgi:hypothetical protein
VTLNAKRVPTNDALAFGRATQVTKEGRAAEIRKARGKK